MIETVLLIVLVCVALALIGLVLIQHGKGADAGASFGAGASQTVFGSAGSGNFLTQASWTLGILFFACCLALGYLARQQAENVGRVDFSAPAAVTEAAPKPASDVPEMPVTEAVNTDADVPAATQDPTPAAPAPAN